MKQITLASASPRRQQLLDQIGVHYQLLPVDIDETPESNESALDFVCRLAQEKAQAGYQRQSQQQPVLGADTIVVLNGRILGKPQSREHGLAMLTALSGNSHEVITAVAMVDGERSECSVSRSNVYFRKLNQIEIEAYWNSGEPADKAGGYGIQGLAAQFIERLDGSYSGVMGLPLFETAELLKQFGIELL